MKTEALDKKIISREDNLSEPEDILFVEDVREAIKELKEDLRNCDEFFNVKDYEDITTTDKFMGIVELFLKKHFGSLADDCPLKTEKELGFTPIEDLFCIPDEDTTKKGVGK